jgi:hypothetical protein
MLASTIQTVTSRPAISTNKTELNTNKPIDHADLSIDASVKKEIPDNTKSKFSVSKIFTITFKYLEQTFHTKVMEVRYGNGQSLFKAVLGSNLSKGTTICWLQRQPQGWALQMGNDIDLGLLKAITFAIDHRKVNLK